MGDIPENCVKTKNFSEIFGTIALKMTKFELKLRACCMAVTHKFGQHFLT